MIKVFLPDGSSRMVPPGSTSMDVARNISEGLARNVLAAKVNNLVVDAERSLPDGAHLQLLTWNDEEGTEKPAKCKCGVTFKTDTPLCPICCAKEFK
ncbi:MAG: TGS domain-containing protein, partial [Flavobacteriia bacterium]|nr:TGS domain-containing protein [Flavobacteriia bacterium]